MDRQFYHHDDLEEVSGGMWRMQRGAKRAKSMALSAALMRDSVGFENAMMQAPKVLADRPFKCSWRSFGCC